MYRTHYCGALTQSDVNIETTVCGWVDVRRDLGGVVFVEIRDHTGKVQLVADPQVNPAIHEIFESLKPEFCVQATGTIQKRPEGSENPELRSGAIEIYPNKITILNTSDILPIPLKDFAQTDETFRLKNRYLDLRRDEMQYNIRLRHKVTQAIREYLVETGHLEIETPMLTLSTPEGARDFLVPSRLQGGKFYALPQSPQLFKQILMSAGFEKYFQIARCFRDEDLRADRQPEFTQVDIEQSFVTVDDIIDMTEKLLLKVMESVGIKIELPLQRMDYKEAIESYGSDKPDLRFDLKLIDFSSTMEVSGFESFANVVKKGGIVKGICASTLDWSRKDFDTLRATVIEDFGAKGLAWISCLDNGEISSPIAKFFSEDELEQIKNAANLQPNQSIFFVADKAHIVHDVLGRLRLTLADKLDLISDDIHKFVWVVNWPLFEKDPLTGAINSLHHPFTSPTEDNLEALSNKPLSEIQAQAYDIVYNGTELGGGSIRIHSKDLQKQIFTILGLSDQDIEDKFDFFMKALSYGTPPHGGIALGLDRLVMLLAKAKSLRQVIPFPKVQSASCPFTNAPSTVVEEQLNELNLKLNTLNLD